MSIRIAAFCRVWVQSRVQSSLPNILRVLALVGIALLLLAMMAYLVTLIGPGIWTADFIS